jgi:polysaccharide biosynthesis/export protein
MDDGDQLTVNIWGRPELSGKYTIGPDGKITLPLVGSVTMAGKTREEAQEVIKTSLSRYYEDLSVIVSVDQYSSYKIMILGRVGVPGSLSFERQPTLLDVLTKAAGLPIGGIGADKAALARCAIFRGRDRVIWIDLKPLLSQGQLQLNIRLARNDLVYLPDADDQLVYVLGNVKAPGAYHLTPTMSFLDALSLAGGPTEDAALSKLSLVRTTNGQHQQIALSEFTQGEARKNFALEEGDILYVPPRGLARFGYVMQKFSPLTGFAVFGTALRP